MAILFDPTKAIDLIQSKRLLVFDFDGVLADSVEVKAEAFAEIYKPYGSEVVKKIVRHHRKNGGVSRFDKFKHYHKTFLQQEIGQEDVDELAKSFSRIVVDKVIASPEITNAGSFIKQFCKNGTVSVINSATPTKEIIRRNRNAVGFSISGDGT